MFDTSWVADLDADAACTAISGTQAELREQEWREIVLAAHWAVLHDPDATTGTGSGAERSVRAGGHGTPQVSEFACAELGLVMSTGFIAASSLLRDAVDLQHRHPLLWAALGNGQGRVWKARQVARLVHAAGLTRDQARFVDAATTGYLDSLTWSGFTRLVEAKIIEADPAAAEARRLAAAMARFVATGQSNEHGLKTLIARAGAGEVIYFVAVCDRIAAILALEGDPDPVDVRRSKALAILANPARALTLLTRHATTAPHPDDPDRTPTNTSEHPGDAGDPSDAGEPSDANHPSDAGDPMEAVDPGEANQWFVDPADLRRQGHQGDPGRGTDADATGAPAGGACPTCLGSATRLDPDKLRPRAVLYVRISEESLRTGAGVAHVENGIGSVTVPALADLLGHYHLTVRPVLDQRDQVPVDAYEVPHAMREALRLARPSSVFPWTRTATSSPDLDHTTPYLSPEQGGPPGQTRIGNLGPLVRLAHRVKTHGRGWRHHQPTPGVYLWRTPHGYWFRVDNDGTHPLGKHPNCDPTNTPGQPTDHTPGSQPAPGVTDPCTPG